MVRVSTTTFEWQTAEPSDTQPVAPPLEFPEEWTLSTSWGRAQIEADQGGPITDAERVVTVTAGEGPREGPRSYSEREEWFGVIDEPAPTRAIILRGTPQGGVHTLPIQLPSLRTRRVHSPI